MSGECENCGDHCLECKCKTQKHSLNYYILRRIEDIGRSRELLYIILKEDIFENLSKHNPYWDSEHEKENEKLYEIRMKLSFIEDNLWKIYEVLSNEEL